MIYILFYMESLRFTIFFHSICTILILLELREMFLNPRSYFSQVWNWLDILGNSSIMIYCIHYEMNDATILQEKSIKQLLIFALFSSGARAVSALRIYKSYRIFIELLKQTIYSMGTFLSLLLFNICLFSLMKYIRVYELGQDSRAIVELFITQYMVMFGSNPTVEHLYNSRIYFINYFGFSLIVNVVSLNLLIAVISNTFDSVQSSIEAHHLRTKA